MSTQKPNLNPFLKKDGKLVNPYINYQGILDSSKVNARTKAFIEKATGLKSTKSASPLEKIVPEYDNKKIDEPKRTFLESITDGFSMPEDNGGVINYTPGIKIANTSLYNNDAAKGQCVWYARGRATEKLGIDPGALGNANQMWFNAKEDAKLSPAASNVKPDTLLSFREGTSAGGKKYGHVIYIEDVIGDTVYYTEGGSGYHKNGTDGVVKTASRQGILNGINSDGSRIGSGAIGLIDITKYKKG